MSTIKINELADGSISITDLMIKSGDNGLATKITLSQLQTFLNTIGVSGYKGVLLPADPVATEDGIYLAGDTGTYTNNGGLVFDLNNIFGLIDVSGTQTVFTKVELPLNITLASLSSIIDSVPTSGSENLVESGGVKDYVDDGIDSALFTTIEKSDLKLDIHPTYTYDEFFGTGSQAMGTSLRAKQNLKFNKVGFFAINNTTNTFPITTGMRCRVFTGNAADANDPDLQNATQVAVSNIITPSEYYSKVWKGVNTTELRALYTSNDEPTIFFEFENDIEFSTDDVFYLLFEIADDGVIDETKTSVEKIGSILGSTSILWEDDNVIYNGQRHSWAISGGVMNSFGLLGNLPFKFYQKQSVLNQNTATNDYYDLQATQRELGSYLDKQLFGSKTTPYNMLIVGDSIFAFQEVSPLDPTTRPIGMYSEDTIGFRAWQMLNPKALTQENKVSNTPYGNMGFIKADHTTLATRTGTFETYNAYTILDAVREFYYTTTLNDYIEFTIPSNAIGFSAVMLEGRPLLGGVNLSEDVEIQVNGVVVDNLDTYILLVGQAWKYREYQLANTGSDYIIRITNKVANKAMAVWGVDYWTSLPALRPTNMGIPSSTAKNYKANTLIAALETSQPDVVLFESFILNDLAYPLDESIKGNYDILKAIRDEYSEASIISMIAHPTNNSTDMTQTKGVDPDLNDNTQKPNYLPMYIQNFKRVCGILNLPYINVYQKFIDDNNGNLSGFPSEWYTDGTHLSAVGFQKYIDLLSDILYFEK